MTGMVTQGKFWRAAGRFARILYPPAVVLCAWKGLCLLGLFPAAILVPPETVLSTFLELARSGEIQDALAASARRVLLGFAFGGAVGLTFGVAIGLSHRFESYVGWLFETVRQIPSIAWAPLLIMIFGIQETFKIVLIAKAAFFPVALNTFDGVRGVPRQYREVAEIYGLSYASLLRRVIFPAALPSIVTGLRLGLSRSWMVLVAAELFASSVGIGHMMDWGRQLFQIDIVMVGIVVIGLIGFALDKGLRYGESRLQRGRGAV